jgi:diguanylate cyclase (GGDEF)-like protein
VIGRTALEINIWANPRDRQSLVELLRQNSVSRDSEVKFRKKNGEVIWVLTSSSVIEIGGVSCLLGVMRDISSAKAAEERIRDLAFYDPLTRLPNRRLLLDRLQQALTVSGGGLHGHALLFIDLDRFKTLNDTFGHQSGDLLLQEVARRIAGCVHPTDTVARLGGDEYAVLLEDLSELPEEAAAQAERIGERVLAAIGQPYNLDGRDCHCAASIGVSIFGEQPQNAEEVMQQAELAMYQAKDAGRNAMRFFSPDLQAAVNSRAALEADLRQGINRMQFVLYYQPQVEHGCLVGAEALLRWNHPARGLLAPDEFIPLAEETGLILPLGSWVLETACAQIAAWAQRKELSAIPIAVNISARQFRHPGFVSEVLATLERSGANPNNLKLELTESMLVENIEDVIDKMTVLKSHGLHFALDDFGTGYSSLSYLRRLPLDQIKIDRAFVRDILADAASGAIAQTLISLGRAMGLSVIAEGIETEEQRDFLARMGCHAFQGFYFGRPQPLHEFERIW